MADITTSARTASFSQLEDPPMARGRRHKLLAVLMLSLAIICGADTFVVREDFGNSNAQWLCKFLELADEIPPMLRGDGFLQCWRGPIRSLFPGLGTECHHLDPRTNGGH